jgi:hypothetical protein
VRIRLAIAGGGGLMQVETFDPLRAAASISTVSKRGVCAAAALFHAGHGGQSIVRPPQWLGPGELLLVRLIGLRGCELVGDHAEPVYDAGVLAGVAGRCSHALTPAAAATGVTG